MTGGMMQASVRRGYVDGPSGQVHFRLARPLVETPAHPLICFHMSPNDGGIYDRFLPFIGADRTVIAPDTPGFGYSDRPAEAPEIADYAASFLEILGALGLEGPVDLMGYHTGSMIATEMARLDPAKVRRLVPVSAPVFDESERQQFRDHYGHKPPTRDGSHLAERWRAMLYWYEHGNGGLDEVAQHFPGSLLGGETAWWGHRAAFNYKVEDALAAIVQPLLLLNPRDDLEDYTLRAAPYLNNGRMLNVPGWGHCFLDACPGDAAALVKSFLDAPDDAPFDSLEFVPSAKAAWQSD